MCLDAVHVTLHRHSACSHLTLHRHGACSHLTLHRHGACSHLTLHRHSVCSHLTLHRHSACSHRWGANCAVLAMMRAEPMRAPGCPEGAATGPASIWRTSSTLQCCANAPSPAAIFSLISSFSPMHKQHQMPSVVHTTALISPHSDKCHT